MMYAMHLEYGKIPKFSQSIELQRTQCCDSLARRSLVKTDRANLTIFRGLDLWKLRGEPRNHTVSIHVQMPGLRLLGGCCWNGPYLYHEKTDPTLVWTMPHFWLQRQHGSTAVTLRFQSYLEFLDIIHVFLSGKSCTLKMMNVLFYVCWVAMARHNPVLGYPWHLPRMFRSNIATLADHIMKQLQLRCRCRLWAKSYTRLRYMSPHMHNYWI